jgi:transposase
VEKQENLFEPEFIERYDHLTREELIKLIKIDRKAIEQYQKLLQEAAGLKQELEEKVLFVDEQRLWLRNELFGKSSEKEPKTEDPKATDEPKELKSEKPRIQRLKERYPNVSRIERHVELKDLPDCSCCGNRLIDSGMTESSEFLTVIPKQYLIIEQKRHKYRCGKCHGELVTAPCPPRIKPQSSYGDAIILDVALSKYCDLIPINRYTRMAERSGVVGLPSQSLIEATHHLSDFLKPVYELLKKEIQNEKVIHADETPHRMLEGDNKTNWQLWGFSSKRTSYFEAHDTRSGDVASTFLKEAACEFLMSDVYSGYGKAIREANEVRQNLGFSKIQGIYCNAHARRRFKEAHEQFPEDSQVFIEHYKEIYALESKILDKPPEEALAIRKQMKPLFAAMKKCAIELIPLYPEKSYIGKAFSYFLKNFSELTAFTGDIQLPIDNNSQERLLRNPVIGRKTWYGTHSKRGAETMTVLFSIIESCKLNRINPREFLPKLVADLLAGKIPYTPASTIFN